MNDLGTPLIVTIIVAIITAVPGIIQAVYAMLAYHRPVGVSTPVAKAAPIRNRSIWIMGVFPIIAWLAVGYDVYDRHANPVACVEYFQSYGIEPPNSLFGIVNGKAVNRYASDYKLYLFGRVAWANVDEMTDTAIAKSAPYTITSEDMSVAIASPKLRVMTNRSNQFDFYLVILPNDISADQILTLADVKKLRGQILVTRSRSDFIYAPNALVISPNATNGNPTPPNTAAGKQP